MSSVLPANYDRDRARQVQRALNENCYGQEGFVALKPDGLFGNLSITALKFYQGTIGEVQNGIVSGRTQELLEEFMNSRYLQDSDFRELAKQYNLEYALLRSFTEVESLGEGTLPSGWATILFERHQFYKRVVKIRGQAAADELARRYPDIVNRSSGGYKGYQAEWDRIQRAMQLSVKGDLTIAAIESTSWGLGQVMGFNYNRTGYEFPIDLMAAAMKGERGQLEAMIRYLVGDPAMMRAIAQKDWARIASLYNGPGYKANNYDVKLKNSYEKWSRLG